MKNVLVTGAAGFIGSNFVDYILSVHKDWHVYGLDLLTYAANRENLIEANKNACFSFIYGDIRDTSFIDSLFRENHFDIIVHFAAETHVDRSIAEPYVFYSTNYIGTATLLECTRKYGIERFHYISTDEVYGDLPLDSNIEKGEESSLEPSSPYSASKAAADLLVLAYKRTYSMPISISRCSNNYGKRQYREKLIPYVVECCIHNRPIGVYGNGLNIREWIYVDDHSRAVDFIITHQSTFGEIYNIGSGMRLSNLEIINDILSIMDKPQTLISFIPDRLGHDRKYSLSSQKLNSLGWRCIYEYENSLRKTVYSYIGK